MKKLLSVLKGTRKARVATLIAVLLLASIKGFSQDPGDSPDGPPPAVPFDDYLLPILLVAGILIAFYTLRKMRSRKVTHK